MRDPKAYAWRVKVRVFAELRRLGAPISEAHVESNLAYERALAEADA
jgi:hypothetical protein